MLNVGGSRASGLAMYSENSELPLSHSCVGNPGADIRTSRGNISRADARYTCISLFVNVEVYHFVRATTAPA